MTKEHVELNRETVRQSDAGRRMTHNQFNEVWAITDIMDGTIRTTGKFREKLGDMAHDFARNERFDSSQAEIYIRDVFAERFGYSLNGLREQLVDQEQATADTNADEKLAYAKAILTDMEAQPELPFYLALDQQSINLAKQLDITQVSAKRQLTEIHREATGNSLYDDAKAISDLHMSKREGNKRDRASGRETQSTRRKSQTRNGPSR